MIPPETVHALAQLSGLVLAEPELPAALARITRIAVEVVEPCEGASLTMRRAGLPDTPAASDDWARALDEMQYVEQEGPCLDCMRTGHLIRVRDLATDVRFGYYGPRAAATGARTVISLPLTADGTTVGALNLYSRTPDAYGPEHVALGELIVAHASLAVQAATAFYSCQELAGQLREALASRAVIEQAKGVLMTQLGLDAEAAFEALRTQSQDRNRKLREIAAEVVERVSRTGAG